MQLSVKDIIESYNACAPLAEANAPPAAWYTDLRIFELERRTVFAKSWQMAGRANQLRKPGQYITCDIAGEPILLVRGNDHVLRGFFNVCRHKGSPVMREAEGQTDMLRCPYHSWTYNLEGQLRSTPDFTGVRNFEPAANSLIPVETGLWRDWVFVRTEPDGLSLEQFISRDLTAQIQDLKLENLHWAERRRYTLACNWKVFVDNYLDGGYHVPHLHAGLNSVLDYSKYTIQPGDRFCVQTSPITKHKGEAETSAVRKGYAFYCWIYPNFMINWYEGVLDTNVVYPQAVNCTEVIFDFYFADMTGRAQEHNAASISISERIQSEDQAICNAVQRGLNSRAYRPGRLSVRREAGEQLFHKLLYHDLRSGLQ